MGGKHTGFIFSVNVVTCETDRTSMARETKFPNLTILGFRSPRIAEMAQFLSTTVFVVRSVCTFGISQINF